MSWENGVIYPTESLVTVQKLSIRPHLGYHDIIYDQCKNRSFQEQLESIQYTPSPAITGA